MPADLKAHVCILQQQEFTAAELDDIKNSPNAASITIINSTVSNANIVHATGNVIATVNERDRGKRRRPSMPEPYSLDASTTKNDAISIGWQGYTEHAKQALLSQTIEVERHSQQIMSQFHVLFIKNNDQISEDIKEFMTIEQIDTIKKSIIEKFEIKQQVLPQEIECNAKAIIKEAINSKINPRKASYMLQGLCSNEMNSNVDDILLIMRNLIERLPRAPHRDLIKESQLCGTLVDAVVRPFIDDPTRRSFLLWHYYLHHR